jgi:23S rRNA pseudouridine1911/1915/1917 synthase
MGARRGDDFDVRLLDGRRETLSYRVASGEEGLRLDQFLAKRLSWRSRSSVRALLDDDQIELSGRSPRASRRVIVGDIVTVRLPRPARDDLQEPASGADHEFKRLFEDEHIVAIDKPPNLPVHPAGRLLHHTVITALHRQYRNFEDPERDVIPKLCHRLDLETSGVLLVAKTRRALTFVQKQFEKRTITKEYLVLVHGAMQGEQGEINLPLGPSFAGTTRPKHTVRHDIGLPSCTRWSVRQRWPDYTLCHVDLLTGRHHQIRVHFSALGHPVVGDKLYGRDETIFLRHCQRELTERDHELLELPRQALHSHSVGFEHPVSGPMRVESPWPVDLAEFCANLA